MKLNIEEYCNFLGEIWADRNIATFEFDSASVCDFLDQGFSIEAINFFDAYSGVVIFYDKHMTARWNADKSQWEEPDCDKEAVFLIDDELNLGEIDLEELTFKKLFKVASPEQAYQAIEFICTHKHEAIKEMPPEEIPKVIRKQSSI